ncbi:DUF2007 domain-containing protein [Patescibacteria group bacterium]|nr:DUF2007 domain-containing protein [Patescibacteria group bacterium]
MASHLITIKTFPSRLEAEMAKQLLASFGIPSFVSADDAGGMRPAPFAYSLGAELIIREEDALKSKEILDTSI